MMNNVIWLEESFSFLFRHRESCRSLTKVAGAIALLRANGVSPTETIDQTANRLRVTGKSVTDTRTGLVFPRIDLLAATSGLIAN